MKRLTSLALFVLFASVTAASAQAEWTVGLTLANEGAAQSLSFGLKVGATDGLDLTLGESGLPPGSTPLGSFLFRDGMTQSFADFRATGPTAPVNWTIPLIPGTGGYPITVTWGLAAFPPTGTIRLQDAAGAVLNLNLRAGNQAVITDPGVTALVVVYNAAAPNLYNPPTVLSPLPGQNLTAGDPPRSIDLEGAPPVFIDPNGDPLTYSASSSDIAVVTVAVSGSNLILNPVAQGSAMVTIKANDGHDGVASSTVMVMVTPPQQNLPPFVVRPIPSRFLRETAAPEVIDLAAVPPVFADPNGDVLTYTAMSADQGVVQVSVTGSELTLDPVAPGQTVITVEASDPSGGRASVTFPVQVIAVTVASPFTLTFTVNGTGSGNGSLILGLDASATDGLDAGLGETELAPRPGTGFDVRFELPGTNGVQRDLRGLDLTGPVTWVLQLQGNAGGYPLELTWDPLLLPAAGVIRLQDLAGGAMVNLNLRGTNQFIVPGPGMGSLRVVYDPAAPNLYSPPVVAIPLPDITLTAGGPEYTVDLLAAGIFSDPENDPLVFRAWSSEPAVAHGVATGALLSVHAFGPGTAQIWVEADDGKDGVAKTSFQVTVEAATVNLPPVMANPLPPVHLTEVSPPFVRDLAMAPMLFTDPNGDVLTYTATSASEAVALASVTGTELTITPVGAGMATVTITATDPLNETVDFLLQVQVAAVTVAEEFTLGVHVANATGDSQGLTLGLAAGATDGLDATFGEAEAPPVPGAATFDARFPLVDFNGLYRDLRGVDLTGPATWTIVLQPGTNGLPVELSWDRQQLPVAGVIRLQPGAAGGGGTFGMNMRSRGSFLVPGPTLTTLHVMYDPLLPNLYSPPVVVNTVPDTTLQAGETDYIVNLTVPGVFQDPENDPLTYRTWSSEPTVAAGFINGSVLTVHPVGPGTAQIYIEADDGREGVAETTLQVTVEAATVNLPPVLANPIPPVHLTAVSAPFVHDLAATPVVFTDPNGDLLTFTAMSSDPAVATATVVGTELRVTPVGPGWTTVRVTAADPSGGEAFYYLPVDVIPVIMGHAFALGLHVANATGSSKDLTIGLAPGATDRIDAALGETEAPPLPGVATFDARLPLEGFNGLFTDLRGLALTEPAVWTIVIQAGTNGYPVELTWDPQQLPPDGVFRLQDVGTGGERVNLNLRAEDSLVLPPPGLRRLRVVYDPAGTNLYSPPVVAVELPDTTLMAGAAAYTVDVVAAGVFTDPENDPLLFRAWSSDPAVAHGVMTGTMLSVHPFGPGRADIWLEADDGKDGVAKTSFEVEVEVAVENLAPTVANPIPPVLLTEVSPPLVIDLAVAPMLFTDPNGDALTYSVESDDEEVVQASVTGTVLTVTPVAHGNATVTITATDPDNEDVEYELSVQVIDVTVGEAFSLGLHVASATGGAQHLTLGLAPGATDDIDPALGETEAPPMPGAAVFDARLEMAGLNGVYTDLRGVALAGPATWTILIQPGTNGYPVQLSWNPQQLPATGVIRLQDAYASQIDVNLRGQSALTLSPGVLLPLKVVYDPTAVSHYNPPVAVLELPDTTLTAGGADFSVDLANPAVFSDPDNDPLVYRAKSSNHGVAVALVTGSMLVVQPVSPGTAQIEVEADDGNDGEASVEFQVTVAASVIDLPPVLVNPVVATPPLQLTPTSPAFVRDLAATPAVFSDPNGDVLTFVASSDSPTVATASITGTRLTVTPVAAGNAVVTVTATDPGSHAVSHSFGVHVLRVVAGNPFILPVLVVNSTGSQKTLTIGLAPGATDGLDPALGETESPPMPPTAVFDARLPVEGLNGVVTDLRGTALTGPATWTLQVQPGAGGTPPTTSFPITLSWDPAILPATGTFRLRDALGGAQLNLNMRAVRRHQESSLTRLQIVFNPDSTNRYNPPRVARAMRDQELTANGTAFSVDLGTAGVFTDPDNDPLTFTATSGNTAIATAGVSGRQLTVNPVGVGSTSVVVTANDGHEGTAQDTFLVTVAAAAQQLPPVVANPLQPLSLVEHAAAVVINLAATPAVFSDPNGDVLTYAASSSVPTVATATVAGSSVTVTPLVAGSTVVTVTADDGHNPAVPTTFTVTVTAVITGDAFRLTVAIRNPAGSSANLILGLAAGATNGIDAALGETEAPPAPPSAVFDARFALTGTNGLSGLDLRGVSLTAAISWLIAFQPGNPGYPVTATWDPRLLPTTGTKRGGVFRLMDRYGGTVVNLNMRAASSYALTQTSITEFKVLYDPTQMNLYNPPTVARQPAAQTLTAGTAAYTLNLNASPAVFTDPDGNTLTYSATSSVTTVATVSVADSVLSVTPVAPGTTTVTIVANDGNDGTAQTTLAVTVEAPTVNLPPARARALPDTTLMVGGAAYAVDLASPAIFTDPNGDALTLTVSSSAATVATATLSGTVLTVSPVAAGSASITVRAADPAGAAAQDTFNVTVNAAASGFALDLTVMDAGHSSTTVRFGIAANATNGMDGALGELEQPPLPPSGNFDVRFTGTGLGNGVLLDLRDVASTSATYNLAFQRGIDGDVVFRWRHDLIPRTAGLTMKDTFNGALGININMNTNDSLVVTDLDIGRVRIFYVPIDTSAARYQWTLGAGWSMISLPVQVANGGHTAIFPDAVSAFRWTGTLYQQVTTLSPCEGYWVNLRTGGTYPVEARAVGGCQKSLAVGWSLIGAPYDTVAQASVTQSPTNILISAFRWTGTLYQQVTSFWRGSGYWVNLRGAGTVTLGTAPAAKPLAVASDAEAVPAVAVGLGQLWADDGQARIELALGVAPDQVVELPPPAPAGFMDLRATVGGTPTWQVPLGEGQAEYPLQIQGSNITLSWRVPASDGLGWDLVLDGQVHPLEGEGLLTLSSTPSQASIVRRAAHVQPLAFALLPNSPNPFNPSTAIRFTLAQPDRVTLRVFGVTGQLVRQLVDDEQAAGRYEVRWDGTDGLGHQVASGVYLLELKAGANRAVRRVALLK